MNSWNTSDTILIIMVIVALIFVGMYFLNKRGMKRMVQAQDFIDMNRMTVQIFVIDKRKEKPSANNLPKAVFEQMPKTAKMRKTNLIRAKVGPQIVTLMCDNPVYDVLPVKKNIKVELAGMYIVGITGMNLEDKKKKSFSEKITASANRQMSEKSTASDPKANKKRNSAQKAAMEQNARFLEKTQKISNKHR